MRRLLFALFGVGAGQVFAEVGHAIVVGVVIGFDAGGAEVGELPRDGEAVGVEMVPGKGNRSGRRRRNCLG